MTGAFGQEQWRPIPGFEGYMVSTFGRVFSIRTRKCLRAQPSGRGHLRVALRRRGRTWLRGVHQLVLLAFVGPCPEGHEGLHADDDPTNNRLTNLRWGTRSENRHDAERNLRAAGGRQKGQALTRDQASRIRGWAKRGVPYQRIGRLFGVSRTTVRKIAEGQIWPDA